VKVHLPVESRGLLRNQEDDHVEATHFSQHLKRGQTLSSLAIALTLTPIDEKGIQTSRASSKGSLHIER